MKKYKKNIIKIDYINEYFVFIMLYLFFIYYRLLLYAYFVINGYIRKIS